MRWDTVKTVEARELAAVDTRLNALSAATEHLHPGLKVRVD